jgi:serine/threonine protein kinase
MALHAGTRLGPYEVLGPIGAGGMGEVYRARDTKLGRDVALKVLRSSIAEDPSRLSRLTHEAQVLALLNHPHIGAIYGLEEFEGLPALVLEFVEGDTLADRIARWPMPLAEVLPVATQIAEALEAAHAQGIVHRDLKPANIKLRPDCTVKVLDFGLAKALDPASTSSANAMNSATYTVGDTATGTIIGTAAYMAPEQARGARVDKRADIWALGVVLYEMLTGRHPFVGPTASDTLAAILTTEPSWEVLPAAARSLVRHCLRKDPKQRLRDVGDVRITLSDITNSGEATDREKRGFPVLVASIALVIAAVSVTLFVVAVRRQPQPSDVMRLSLNLGPRTGFQQFRQTGLASSTLALAPMACNAYISANSTMTKPNRWEEPRRAMIPFSLLMGR